ncbi:hypothetical protein EDD15DRAFT_2378109 [Pisolithus albus]|nr:hypothetical protein EDD15DRAFT_2378109 [Pisolithus albus]
MPPEKGYLKWQWEHEEEQCCRATEEQRQLAEESLKKQLEQEVAARAMMANELVEGSGEDAKGEAEEDEVETMNNMTQAPLTGSSSFPHVLPSSTSNLASHVWPLERLALIFPTHAH